MDRIIKPSRLAVCILFFVLLLGIYMVALYKLQIIDGNTYYENSQNNIVSRREVVAPRGNILDRYGRTLVSNRPCNNITINTDDLFQQEDPNGIILELVQTVTQNGNEYSDTLPITKSPPFEYISNMTDLQKTTLDGYIKNAHEKYGLQENPTAVELMAFFRTRYKIDNNYSAEETRTIAGIRYELNSRHIIATSAYIFSEDVSIDLITKLMEENIRGIRVEVSYIREYNTMYGAHILGYVGPMSGEEYSEKYQKLGYLMNAVVGKQGAEYAFEEYLRSKDGSALVSSNANGTVIGTAYDPDPEAGKHVYLTLDIGLQETAEQALASGIAQMNEQREKNNAIYEQTGQKKKILDEVPAGAIVALDVKTGEPLAIASYPTFNLETFFEDYDVLSKDKKNPLLNRATQGLYAPGSTFKMSTALAALNAGIVQVETTIYDEGIYTKYPDYQPKCWIHPQGSHGNVNVVSAIENSCNYYFYDVSDRLGIDKMSAYAHSLGLGEKTGIELPELKGMVASAEQKMELKNEKWYQGDTLQAGIGQSDHQFTPLQLASYIGTLTNNGTRYSASILKSVRSYDYAKELYSRTPEVLSQAGGRQEYFDAVKQGMRAVAQSGTAREVFGDYKEEVAAKTGTAQLGENITNNGVFVCYAPYDDPEIAVVVVIEKGESGSGIANIARTVLDYYFLFQSSSSSLEQELTLMK